MKIKYILVSIVSIFFGIFITLNLEQNSNEEDKLKSAINDVYDSVLYIESYKNDTLVSSGSGFIYKISDKAYIITNNHVIEEADEIKIVNSDNKEISAEIIGSDIYSDIAILSIDKKYAKKSVKLGNTDKVELGDQVFTVGTPVDKKYLNTITTGIVSGLNRKVKVTLSNGNYLINAIQTDASINPGNSGGPLVNLDGEVIGINSMKSEESDVEGISFTIPINDVKDIINKLEKGNEIERPTIGLELINITNKEKLIENYISIDKSITYGVVITDVYKDYPAYNAGLKIGDIIININDDKIEDMSYFKYYLFKHNPGDKIKITYIRANEKQVVDLKL